MHSKRTIIPKRLDKSLFVPPVVVEQRIKQGRVWSAAQNHIRLHPLKLQTVQRQRLDEAPQPRPVDVSLPLSVPPRPYMRPQPVLIQTAAPRLHTSPQLFERTRGHAIAPTSQSLAFATSTRRPPSRDTPPC